jgi:hypothetical protein
METDKYKVITPEGYEKIELPFFDEWVNALESGEYKQGEGFLCKVEEYCCLGVLSKIQGRLTKLEGSDLAFDAKEGEFSGLGKDNPCHVQLGGLGFFPASIRVVGDGWTGSALSDCNDAGFPFKEIANIIKTVWKPKS